MADNVELSGIAAQTEGFSGSDLKELCRNASLYRVRDYVANTQFSDKMKNKSVNSSSMKLSE
ncbi:hypothetical protein L9G16_22640, partial [Shewanella sp. A25]|nr:hypothetical protein [Shewanella shenzhenensis]